MATTDVPGYSKKNNDNLAMGCWAEHDDGSLVFVESTEGGRVIYCMFDLASGAIVEYRDAMEQKDFMKSFSHGAGSKEKWVWHDKTPFPWNKVIKSGARDGVRFASASDQLSAAQRVAESLKLRGSRKSPEDYDDRIEKVVTDLKASIVKALDNFLGK